VIGYPLTVLDESWIKILEIISDFFYENIDENAVEVQVEMFFLNQREDIKQRLKDIKPLYLSAYMHHRCYSLYHEAISCYIHGNFNAVCILCRAISEMIAKKYIIQRGFGNLLDKALTGQKNMSIPGILKNKLSIPNGLLVIYRRIHTEADRILHDISWKSSRQKALNVIDLLHKFIKQFPRSV